MSNIFKKSKEESNKEIEAVMKETGLDRQAAARVCLKKDIEHIRSEFRKAKAVDRLLAILTVLIVLPFIIACAIFHLPLALVRKFVRKFKED